MVENQKITQEQKESLIQSITNDKSIIVATDNIIYICGEAPNLYTLLTLIIKRMYENGLKERKLYETALDLGLVDTAEAFNKVAVKTLKDLLNRLEDKR